MAFRILIGLNLCNGRLPKVVTLLLTRDYIFGGGWRLASIPIATNLWGIEIRVFKLKKQQVQLDGPIEERGRK